MLTDTEIRTKAMEILIASLGEVDAERFINLLLREPFDYTLWQRNLWQDKTIYEISQIAMLQRRNRI